MLIRVINPNTTASMTAAIGRAASLLSGPGVTVEAVTPGSGPASIESHYDEALAVPGVLDEIIAGDAAGADGYVIACFGDPGLLAARELARGPVVGIAEAAMRTATYLGRSFSVVTTLARTIGRAKDLALQFGVADACAGYHAIDVAVLGLESDPTTYRRLLDGCRTALETDGSDVVVLGCAGFAPLARDLGDDLGVPVVDGVTAGVAAVRGLIDLGLTTSRALEFALPPAKTYTGDLARFTR